MRYCNKKKLIPVINSLLDKSIVRIEEEIKDKYKPRIETFVRLTKEYEDENKLRQAFEDLEKKAFKQLQLLLSYVNKSRNKSDEITEIRRSELIQSVNATYQQCDQLIKKGILELYEQEVDRIEIYSKCCKRSFRNSAFQTSIIRIGTN